MATTLNSFSKRWSRFLLIALIITVCTTAIDGRSTQKGAKVTLHAPWPATPLVHEVAEFLADESPAAFWNFARDWQPSATSSSSIDQCWSSLREHASKSLTSGMTSMLDVFLSLRYYSPRLEAFRRLAQLATEQRKAASGTKEILPCCWTNISGTVVTSSKEVERAVKKALNEEEEARPAADVFPFDHIYQPFGTLNTSDPNVVHAILYAPIGSACSAQFDSVLRDLADAEPRLAYIWRPVASPNCDVGAACLNLGAADALTLPGYGVEFAIKNMEYNASDDTKAPIAENGATSADSKSPDAQDKEQIKEVDENEEIAGFNIATLLHRKPSLRKELLAFREHLLSSGNAAADSNNAGADLKVWDLVDIGLQSAHVITSSDDQLRMLRDISQNFPSLAGPLSRTTVNSTFRDAAHSLPGHAQQLASTRTILLNGVSYEMDDFNLHEFADALRREVKLMDALASAGLPAHFARKAALFRGYVAEDGTSNTPRLDVRPDVEENQVIWVTDVEKDPQFANLPRSLSGLLQPSFFGQMPSARRNVFNALFLFDPSTATGLSAGRELAEMSSQGWPVRFGIMLMAPSDQARQQGVAVEAPRDKFARLLAGIASSTSAARVVDFMYLCDDEIRTMKQEDGTDNGEEEEDFAEILWKAAQRVFTTRATFWGYDSTESASAALHAVVAGSDDVGTSAVSMLAAMWDTAHSTGLTNLLNKGADGAMILNGAVSRADSGASWRNLVIEAFQSEMPAVQNDVYHKRIQDSDKDLLAVLLDVRKAAPRYNPRALPGARRGSRHVRLGEPEDPQPPRQMALFGPEVGLATLAKLPIRYFTSSTDTENQQNSPSILITHWAVASATDAAGLRLLSDALQHSSEVSRMGLVLNLKFTNGNEDLSPVERLVLAAVAGLLPADTLSRADLSDMLTSLSEETQQSLESLTMAQLDTHLPESLAKSGTAALLKSVTDSDIAAAAEAHSRLVHRGLGLAPSQIAVVTNGRVVVVAGEADDLIADDFQLLDIHAQRNQFASKALQQTLEEAAKVNGGWPSQRVAADAAAAISSALATLQPAEDASPMVAAQLSLMDELNDTQHPFVIHSFATESAGSNKTKQTSAAPLLIQAIMDPLTKHAQQSSGVLNYLRSALRVDMDVLLTPSTDTGADLPLKTFYRFVTPDVSTTTASLPPPPAAVFKSLPPRKTLTLEMDVPEAWLVTPINAAQDLDNLRLEDLPSQQPIAHAEFTLEALLVTGMCIDTASLEMGSHDGVHPRGVQLQLGTATQHALTDTLVMSNLGYFQLQASPGVWDLRLAPGRSQLLYDVHASSGAATAAADRTPKRVPAPASVDAEGDNQEQSVAVPVAVVSFSGRNMLLVLRKKQEYINEDVLDVSPSEAHAAATGTDGGSSVWSRLKKVAAKPDDDDDGAVDENTAGDAVATKIEESDGDNTIHVFTVASGHMYERLQKIMILSATKRGSRRLKFWFIQNYMSPQMKAFLPYMAKEYDFDYQFVTYKWPSWLHKQTEKQRRIWAYKILFLDVLFPLNLKKVIFCDSDQVIRADLAELWDHDLHGAPYGYTPFCDTNRDMEGFRFWKQGFWREHLNGKPYHISALYVVDLERFRQLAAGDKLRIMYDSLSKDPNSLSNLDQDLPNYAQSAVPIHSLPQEWLWCETWCGEASRPSAKTIDLCNNPLTKEPKLQSARRIVAEWPDLDREAREFTSKVEGVLAGRVGKEELAAGKGRRFITHLKPMVEGSVRVEVGEVDDNSGSSDAAHPKKQGSKAVPSAGGAAHDATEL